MRKRFFRAAVLSILTGLSIAFLFAIPFMNHIVTGESERELDTALALVTGYSLSDAAPNPWQALAESASSHVAQTGQALRITLIAKDGTVLGDSESDPAAMENHAARPEVKAALADGRGGSIRRSATTGQREMYRAVRQTSSDGGTVIYRASLPLNAVEDVRRVMWLSVVAGIIAGLSSAMAAAHYSAGRVVRPLQDLTRAARAIAEGERPVRVEEAPDEIGELSGAFNRMSERLTDARRELESSRERLAGILQGMDDGVAAVDAQGRVALLTGRARELLGNCEPGGGAPLDGGPNCLYLRSLLEKVAATGEPARDTLKTVSPAERILEIYAAPVKTQGASDGALAVLSDVTRLRRLETMRSEFVANVTHELKTPLTSIRGYIELLRAAPRDEQTAQSFYEIIEIEADRLQKLTDDLLQLSEIESGAREDESDAFASVREVAEPIAESLRPEADARGVSLSLEIPASLRVAAAPRRLHQLLKNLMENAVKYNREGGSVKVSGGVERGVAVLRVRDTGIGISAEHLDRVFERFYRVDKGRSREQGGTGLGLSIVKHIAGLYGGDVRVESRPGEGSIFTVRLPVAPRG